MTPRRYNALCWAAAAVLTLAGCSGPDVAERDSTKPTRQATAPDAQPIALDPVEKDCTWVIGNVGALRGEFANLIEPMTRGLQLAVKVANAAPDVACRLRVVSRDSGGLPARAASIAARLARNDRLVACFCGYFSGEAMATGKVLSREGIFLSGTATSVAIPALAFKTWFRAVASDYVQGRMLGRYIREVQRPARVVIVHDRGYYPDALTLGVLRSLGKSVKESFVVDQRAKHYRDLAHSVERARPDAVVYAGYTPEAIEVVRAVGAAGVRAPFFGGDGMKDPSFGDASLFAEGVRVSCGCSDPLSQKSAGEFVELYRQVYGTHPRLFAAEIFDMASFVTQSLAGLDPNEAIAGIRARVVAFFRGADGLEGAAKHYSWNEVGELEPRPEQVWIYQWSYDEVDFVPLGPVDEVVREPPVAATPRSARQSLLLAAL